MVCVTEEETFMCCVHNDIAALEPETTDVCENGSKTATTLRDISVRASHNVEYLIDQICKEFDLEESAFELFMQSENDANVLILLSDSKEKLLKDIGVNFTPNTPKFIIREPVTTSISNNQCSDYDYDLSLGASASPTQSQSQGPLDTSSSSSNNTTGSALISSVVLQRQDSNPYRGLVNQAMTCYLNSLLQALYMTPEFRNALYHWVFDGCDPSKSIPYQLQKLFLNLQTSAKSAVETTELTRSFGWDLSEAWQQHDIQELCRVMFDALEQKFKDTDQADLINRLYQGQMIDYVKCLECKTEKSRVDTFLDIPLPVRPFGSTVAYGSVEEALRAFVQPETLDGNNQYHCDKCDKKCDAHKGLKFATIPYLLTLHLKRFDFDYSTMHRIKLNDKVTFPETLDLNSFIHSSTTSSDLDGESTTAEVDGFASMMNKCDDSSTTDSGSALDDESQSQAGPDSVGPAAGCTTTVAGVVDEDLDEGIDVSSSGTNNENEKNRRSTELKGPYVYELFSIMIHSGSASGGHYYAYIKDFRTGKWYCFDDQTVSNITYDDIRKTYGGGPLRSYYSGAYSSSTNAYMLMYRQIDPERNVQAIGADDLPAHIKALLKSLHEREEYDRRTRERELVMCKLKLYCNYPNQSQQIETKLYLHNESTLSEALQEAYRKTQLEGLVPIEHCRLVSYNKFQESIECSFEGRDDETIQDILSTLKMSAKDLLLEIRDQNAQFVQYKPGGMNLKCYQVDLELEDVFGPVMVRAYEAQTIKEFKQVLANTLNMSADGIQIAIEGYNEGVGSALLDNADDELLCQTALNSAYKLYVASKLDDDPAKPFLLSQFHKIIDKFEHIISLDIFLPQYDKNTLDLLSIPALDQNENHDDDATNNDEDKSRIITLDSLMNSLSADPAKLSSGDSSSRSLSPKPLNHVPGGSVSSGIGSGEPDETGPSGTSDQSNSEDSSLSDSDRTLVGDAPDECLAQLSSTSNSSAGSDQHLSSPEDHPHTVYCEENWDDPQTDEKQSSTTAAAYRCPNYYFKATEVNRTLKVLVDKRTNLGKLKKELEPYVGVPQEYFKVYRQYSSQETEYNHLTETLSMSRDGEKLTVKLGRVLKENEHSGKVYLLQMNATETARFLCDWVITKGALVKQVKQELLAALKKQLQIEIPFDRCRLRKKNWRNPNKVYLDEQRFTDDILLHSNFEIFVQELPEPETLTDSDQLLLFARQWCPSTMDLKPFHEVVLDKLTIVELKEKLSTFSGIPAEHIEISMLKGTFPYDMSVLSILEEIEWINTGNLLNEFPFHIYDDGHGFLYRDKREPIKQLTPQERKEINNKENSRLGRYNSSAKSNLYSSPRKERALKIYLDTSPNKKSEEPEVD